MKDNSVVATERSARLPTTGRFISRMKATTTRITGAATTSSRGSGIILNSSRIVRRNLLKKHATDNSTG